MSEGPWPLPEGWRWVRLGEVASREAISVRPSETPDETFVFLGMEHVKAGQWDPPAGEEVRGAELKSQVIRFRPGLVLYGKLRPYLNKVVVPRSEGVASPEFVPLEPGPSTDPEYLAAFLRTPWFVSYASSHTTGSRQPRVRLDALWEAPVPLPPLDEQKRIVARIEELMERIHEARRLREQARADAERLWQSVLADTFLRPGDDLPAGWRWVRLREVASREAVFVRPSDAPDREFVFVGMEHVRSGQWEPPVGERIRGSKLKSQVVRFWPGLVLYGKLRPYLNKVVVPEEEGVASPEFVPIRPNPDLDARYLGAFMRTPWFVDHASRHTVGSRQPRVRLEALWDTPIPLPPLDEQKRIVAHLDAVRERVRELRAAQDRTAEALETLERSILDRAFRGEL